MHPKTRWKRSAAQEQKAKAPQGKKWSYDDEETYLKRRNYVGICGF